MATTADEMRRKQLRDAYMAGINRAIDHIEANIERPLSLEKVAAKAGFSKFHFHRLFAAMTGETLNRFVQRVRVEKAATKLKSNPGVSITEIALDCGFSSPAAFARVFKEYFGVSAGEWRESGFPDGSKIRKTDRNISKAISNNRKAHHISVCHSGDATYDPEWRIEMTETKTEMKVEVSEVQEMNVAYVRHVGPYAGQSQVFEGLIGRLMTWAGPRGLIKFPETKMLSVYHDDPKVTEEDKLRVSMCITVPEDTNVDGEVGLMKIPGGTYAVAHCEITDPSGYANVWQALMGSWMPESGYQPADGVAYELYLNDPKQHPEGHHIVDLCVPVKPL
ncbi:MAG: AraC family transcriptional regulator [Myxococcota bacterium]|nr:AraC family transcriptional regulator [Myxococcota bacterium]